MPTVRMPTLNADIETGKLVRWLRKQGEEVNEGDIIAVVDTDAGPADVLASHSGTLKQILVQENTRIPIGTPLARIYTGDDADEDEDAEEAPAEAEPRNLGLEDMCRLMADAMARSQREIPHYHLGSRITLRRATQRLESRNAGKPADEQIPMTALLLKAVARAIEEFPRFNGFFLDGEFTPSECIHVGAVIAIRGGVTVAPAIYNCNCKALDDIRRDFNDLVWRVRAGEIRPSELTEPTITVTSLGERGVASVSGMIYPPQVAMVGFGAPHLAPIARADGKLVSEPVVDVSLAGDHRVTGPQRGTRFLNRIASLLQEPEKLDAVDSAPGAGS